MGNQRRLIFFGDSICVGQGVSIHRSWVSRMAARVDEISERSSSDLVVVNASVNGNTTRQALERMPYDIQSHGVALLLVQFGMNDCNYWQTDQGLPRVSPTGFVSNLEEIIQRGFRFGAQRILINTNHPTLLDTAIMPGTEISYEESNRRYNQLIREVAARHDDRLVLNDVEERFLVCTGGSRQKLGELLLDDKLHVSVRGHGIYFNLILPPVESAIELLGFAKSQQGR